MTSIIFVKRISKYGRYVSESLTSIAGKETNPYRIAVNPIDNVIRFAKVQGGFLVCGEGFVFDDTPELVKKHKTHYFVPVNKGKRITHVFVANEEDL